MPDLKGIPRRFKAGDPVSATLANATNDALVRQHTGAAPVTVSKVGNRLVFGAERDFARGYDQEEILLYSVLEEFADYLLCAPFHNQATPAQAYSAVLGSDVPATQRVYVAKPYLLQRTPWDGKTVTYGGVHFTYSYTSNNTRTVSWTDGVHSGTYTEVIDAGYFIGDVIAARPGLTGHETTSVQQVPADQQGGVKFQKVTVPVQWSDINEGGRDWEDTVDCCNLLQNKGDLLTFSTVPTVLPVGGTGGILTSDPSTATGLKWSDPYLVWSNLTQTLTVTGTNGQTTTVGGPSNTVKLSGGPALLDTNTWPLTPSDGDFGYDGTHLYFRHGTTSTDLLSGGGSPLTTKGDLLTHSTVDARQPVGGDGGLLFADSAQATGLHWSAPAALAWTPGAQVLTVTGTSSQTTTLGGGTNTLALSGGPLLFDSITWPGSPADGNLGYDGTHLYFRHGLTNHDLLSSSGSPLTTKGDLYAYSTTDDRLPVGTDGTLVFANSAASVGLDYSANMAWDSVNQKLTVTGTGSQTATLGGSTGASGYFLNGGGQVTLADGTHAIYLYGQSALFNTNTWPPGIVTDGNLGYDGSHLYFMQGGVAHDLLAPTSTDLPAAVVYNNTNTTFGAVTLDFTSATITGLTISGYAQLAAANTFTAAPQTIIIDSASNVGLLVQGAGSQSANLTEWRDSTNALLAWITPVGEIDTASAVRSPTGTSGGYYVGGDPGAHFYQASGLAVVAYSGGTNNPAVAMDEANDCVTAYGVNSVAFAVSRGGSYSPTLGVDTTLLDGSTILGGICTHGPTVTPAADGTYASPTSITIQSGIITAIT